MLQRDGALLNLGFEIIADLAHCGERLFEPMFSLLLGFVSFVQLANIAARGFGEGDDEPADHQVYRNRSHKRRSKGAHRA